ncbi:MAG TPA: hypothetical protein VL854_11795 [Nitrososphaeraceae archaeon]|nr:hypothetical protein [Nitrososphaeraceae archaeon]
MNPIRELISQWGQWDLNLACKWGQLLGGDNTRLKAIRTPHVLGFY